MAGALLRKRGNDLSRINQALPARMCRSFRRRMESRAS
nr:MAG TPA: hypothetical protein [Caudoviricetes sp.]